MGRYGVRLPAQPLARGRDSAENATSSAAIRGRVRDRVCFRPDSSAPAKRVSRGISEFAKDESTRLSSAVKTGGT
jgi:hypothetical protein